MCGRFTQQLSWAEIRADNARARATEAFALTGATLRNGTANFDGNWQSICSWGQVIQKRIDASGFSNGNQMAPAQPINCPSPTPATGGLMAGTPTSGASAASVTSPLPSTARQPAVASTDVVVSGAQISADKVRRAERGATGAQRKNAFPSDTGPQSKEDQIEGMPEDSSPVDPMRSAPGKLAKNRRCKSFTG